MAWHVIASVKMQSLEALVTEYFLTLMAKDKSLEFVALNALGRFFVGISNGKRQAWVEEHPSIFEN
jgi:hypothetical protein